MLGLITAGFPNLYMLTGPGSAAVLASLTVHNEQNVDWVADCIAHVDGSGHRSIVPIIEAEDAWTRVVEAASAPLLRKYVNNYMVRVNPDGTRRFIPYAGGFGTYVQHCQRIAETGTRASSSVD